MEVANLRVEAIRTVKVHIVPIGGSNQAHEERDRDVKAVPGLPEVRHMMAYAGSGSSVDDVALARH